MRMAGMMRRLGEKLGVDDRLFPFFLTRYFFLRPPPGQGYGQRGKEYGRYDAPLGCVHRWDRVFLVLTNMLSV